MTSTSTIEKRAIVSPENILETFARAAVNVYFPPVDQFGHPSVGRFLIDNGRLPALGDEVPPWHYRGWLVPYIQMCEEHPAIAPRYDYVLRTLEAGKLLDEPIPQVNFVSEGAADAKGGVKMLADMVKITEYRSGFSRSIDLVCDWLGFALAVSNNPPELDAKDQEKLYRLFDVSKWLLHPTDYIGQHMAEMSVGQSAGFYPTPMSICTMMAMMTHGSNDRDMRSETVMDCAVGTGRLLLTGSNYSLRLYGQDINYLCVLVTKINLALFAPWFHIPESYYADYDSAKGSNQVSAPPKDQPRDRNEPETGQKLIAADGTNTGEQIFTTEIEQMTLFDLR